MLLGTQLGKTNIAAWASKKEEEKDASLSLKTVPMDQSMQNITEIRAAAWEEAEKAKYLARCFIALVSNCASMYLEGKIIGCLATYYIVAFILQV